MGLFGNTQDRLSNAGFGVPNGLRAKQSHTAPVIGSPAGSGCVLGIDDLVVRDSLTDHQVGEGLVASVVDVVGKGLPSWKADVATRVKGETVGAEVKRSLA